MSRHLCQLKLLAQQYWTKTTNKIHQRAKVRMMTILILKLHIPVHIVWVTCGRIIPCAIWYQLMTRHTYIQMLQVRFLKCWHHGALCLWGLDVIALRLWERKRYLTKDDMLPETYALDICILDHMCPWCLVENMPVKNQKRVQGLVLKWAVSNSTCNV